METALKLALSLFFYTVVSTLAFAGWTTPPFPSPDYFRIDDAKWVRMCQVYSASVERAQAAGINPPTPTPTRRNERQFLVGWKSWCVSALARYADQTVFGGIGSNFHLMPYIRPLDHEIVIDHLEGTGANIPNNYFSYTPFRQLNGEGVPVVNEHTEEGHSTLDYGYVYVTNILAMMTWTLHPGIVDKSAQDYVGQSYGRAWYVQGRLVQGLTYDDMKTEAEASNVGSRGFTSNQINWSADAMYNVDAGYYRYVEQEATRGYYTNRVPANIEGVVDLYVAAEADSTGELPDEHFHDKGFNLVESRISLVASSVKPLFVTRSKVEFDPTGFGPWPDDPAVSGDYFESTGERYSHWGFSVTQSWIIIRWDATADGFKYR